MAPEVLTAVAPEVLNAVLNGAGPADGAARPAAASHDQREGGEPRAPSRLRALQAPAPTGRCYPVQRLASAQAHGPLARGSIANPQNLPPVLIQLRASDSTSMFVAAAKVIGYGLGTMSRWLALRPVGREAGTCRRPSPSRWAAELELMRQELAGGEAGGERSRPGSELP